MLTTSEADDGVNSVESGPAGVVAGVARVVTDRWLRIVQWNEQAAALYGWSADEALGRRISDVIGAPDARMAITEAFEAAGDAGGEVAATHRHRDGSQIAVWTATAVRFAEPGTIAGLAVESRAATRCSTEPAPESGRQALLVGLDAAGGRASSLVVLFDVDQFHLINQRHGNSFGDAALGAIAERLSTHLDTDAQVVCLDADRFGVRCHPETIAAARDIIEGLERAMSPAFDVGGLRVSMSFSAGAAWGPTDPLLFEHAMSALRSARRQGGGRLCWFDLEQWSSEWPDRETFVTDMRAGMASGAIYVTYQPIVELASGHVVKVEALTRWDHPVRGAVSPGTFIPIAERHRVIDELGAWVLQTACGAVVEMHRAGIDVDVTVNLSAIELHHPDVAECVSEALETAGLAASRLWIEVTESVLVDDQAVVPLHRLHDIGVRLIIDDFGTGFASFQYLTRLPVDGLKIDRSFVAGLGVDASDTAIVRSVIGLGRELGMQVVAEGVETESQRAQLVALNCRLGQGWLFDRAITLNEFLLAYRGSAPLRPGGTDAEANESLRLAALEACRVLDTDHEAAFDALVQLATQLMSTPMALVSLIDANRQWFKARIGIDLAETPRDISFCAHAIQRPDEPLVVADATLDDRFSDNPMVTGTPGIRSYAGVPLRSREGLALGTLCVLDTTPRAFDTDQLALLTTLAEQTTTLLDLRRRAAELHALIQRLQAQNLARGGTSDLASGGDPGAVAAVLADLRLTSPATPAATGAHEVRIGPLVVDLVARTLTNAGEPVGLTDEQFDLVAFLAARPGHVFAPAELCRRVWPNGQTDDGLRSVVRDIQARLEPDPSNPILLAGSDNGYRFEPGSDAGLDHRRQAELRNGTFTHVGGRILAVDDDMLSMLAATKDEVVGRDLIDFVAPSSHPAALARLEMRSTGHEPGPQLITMQATDGHQFLTLIDSTTSELEHQVVGVTLHFQEVLDPPRRLRQFVSSVLNEVSDAVIVTDSELHVLSWNRAAQRLYGWSESDVLGHSLADVVRPRDECEHRDAMNELERAEQYQQETTQITRDGVEVKVRSSVHLIRDEHGAVTGVVSVNRPADPTADRPKSDIFCESEPPCQGANERP